jgi:hypothetical protein
MSRASSYRIILAMAIRSAQPTRARLAMSPLYGVFRERGMALAAAGGRRQP